MNSQYNMNRIFRIGLIISVLLIIIAAWQFTILVEKQLDLSRESLLRQVEMFASRNQRNLDEVTMQASFVFRSDMIRELLKQSEFTSNTVLSVKKFYENYPTLIQGIIVGDNQRSRLIVRESDGSYQFSPITSENIAISDSITLEKGTKQYQVMIPIKTNNGRVTHFVSLLMDPIGYFTKQMQLEYSGPYSWTFLGRGPQLVHANYSERTLPPVSSLRMKGEELIWHAAEQGLSGTARVSMNFPEDDMDLVIAYAPVHIADDKYYAMFAVNRAFLLTGLQRVTMILSCVFLVMLGLISGLFLSFIKHKHNQEVRLLQTNAAVENAGDGICITSPDFKVLYANNSYKKWFGKKNDYPVISPTDLISDYETKALVRERLESGMPWAGEFSVPNSEGEELPLLARVSQITDRLDENRGALFILTDITERKKSDKMKNEFISTVSHELRTPLTSIRGSLGLIMSGAVGEISTQALKLLEIANTNSERLVRLINDILDIEKIEAGHMEFHPEKLQLLPLIEKSIDDNRGFAQQMQVKLTLRSSLHHVKAFVDPDRFIQVMTNLLSNAAKFSAPQAEVWVDMSITATGLIKVAVEDKGIGIPEEFQGRLFQKFAQADSSDTRSKGGTGLGLSISKAIMEKFSGSLQFDTKPGEGSVFYLTLPQVVEETDEEQNYTGPYFLICEDNPDIAHLLQLVTRQADANAKIVYSAEEAREELKKRTYTGLLLDLLLPGQQGLTLIQELRRIPAYQNLPIIVISAVANEEKHHVDGALGVLDWIQKPLDLNRLSNAIHHVLHKQSGDKPKVLHVEDDKDNLAIVQQIVGNSAELYQAVTMHEAKEYLRAVKFDLIILDLSLPDGSGSDLIPIQRDTDNKLVPVLIFSATDPPSDIAKMVSAALIKSKTSNDELLQMIKDLLVK